MIASSAPRLPRLCSAPLVLLKICLVTVFLKLNCPGVADKTTQVSCPSLSWSRQDPRNLLYRLYYTKQGFRVMTRSSPQGLYCLMQGSHTTSLWLCTDEMEGIPAVVTCLNKFVVRTPERSPLFRAPLNAKVSRQELSVV